MSNPIESILEQHGDFAHGGDVEDTAIDWHEYGFTAIQADEWLNARCFTATAAASLQVQGFTPDEVKTETDENVGMGQYADTIGYKVANGDLSVEAARTLLGEST